MTTETVSRERMLTKAEFGFYQSVEALEELKARFCQYIEDRIAGVDYEWEAEGFETEKAQWVNKIDSAIAEWQCNKGFKGPTYLEAGIHSAARCGVTKQWVVSLI